MSGPRIQPPKADEPQVPGSQVLDSQVLGSPAFWHLPLGQRMAGMAVLRELEPFLAVTIADPFTKQDLTFYAALRHAEVVEISRRPLDFCSGKGSTAIANFPPDITEFFSSFIAMDDPRHARQRGIVSRSFTPRHLRDVLDSVERICDEVIDEMCEKGKPTSFRRFPSRFPSSSSAR